MRWPAWDRLSFTEQPEIAPAAPRRAAARTGRAGAALAGSRSAPRSNGAWKRSCSARLIPSGLVRAAEVSASGRLVVQLTDLGRYVLAMGPTPPPRTTFEQFLFVQPNFEVIAYRQGLTPHLVGRLSRFAWWSQIGAALELKLTRESIVLGLDWGLTAETILEILTRHSQRPLAAGRHRRHQKLGDPPRARDLLRRRDVDRVRLVCRARRGRWRPGPRALRPRRSRSPSGFSWSRTTRLFRSTAFA